MARINLLPWREELRKTKQSEFMVVLGLSLLGSLLLGIVVHFSYARLISFQNSRNAFLDQQIAIMDKRIEAIKELEKEKQRLLARITAIEQLQSQRPLNVRLFDELVKGFPEGVSLQKLTQKGTSLTLEGVAESNARVSSLMRNLDASPWLTNPELGVIQVRESGEGRLSEFTLNLTQVLPPASVSGQDDVASRQTVVNSRSGHGI